MLIINELMLKNIPFLSHFIPLIFFICFKFKIQKKHAYSQNQVATRSVPPLRRSVPVLRWGSSQKPMLAVRNAIAVLTAKRQSR